MMRVPSRSSHEKALKTIQTAVSNLSKWSGIKIALPDEDSDALKEAKKYLRWLGEPIIPYPQEEKPKGMEDLKPFYLPTILFTN
jgi:hypothetical protein